MDKKVVLIIAQENFKDVEYQKTREILENDYDVEIKVAAQQPGKTKGSGGLEIDVDMPISEVDPNNFDAIAFIGGSGATVYFDDEIALELARKASAGGKVVAAICCAPVILANAGLLEGKRATVFPNEEFIAKLKEKGAEYSEATTETQGNIITAKNPDAAEEFGEKIGISLMSEF